MGDTAWAEYKKQMKEKRCHRKKGNRMTGKLQESKHLTIQRLSSEVCGKAQKFSRIGAREFVPFEDEMTLGNVQNACEKHFLPAIGKSVTCDVLAGEQGPSCSTLEQIPNQKLIHIRFIERDRADTEQEQDHVGRPDASSMFAEPDIPTRKRKIATASVPLTCDSDGYSDCWQPKRIKVFPTSLSVSDMMKLGMVIQKKATTKIELHSFDLGAMGWSATPLTVELSIEKESFAEGGFRKAYRAKSQSKGFAGSVWVVKRYLTVALKSMEDTDQTPEEHTKKVVQMHTLAKNFADQLAHKLKVDDLIEFGQALEYGTIYLGKEVDTNEYVTVEEFIPGQFVKYINNNGLSSPEMSVHLEKAQCLAHFSYEKSNNALMVVDIQGTGYKLYDPEIASSQLHDNDKFLFCTGNLSHLAIDTFVSSHECNIYCKSLGLKTLI